MTEFSPREIVSELDRFIVGQADAKRAVSIALRNRWRRLQLHRSLREEVLPKNILMIGPTGVGKTEIARRLAQARRRAVHQGRGDQIHRGRLCRPRRRADHPRPRRVAIARPASASARTCRRAPSSPPKTRARRPGGRRVQRRDPRLLSQEIARRRTQRQGNRDRDAVHRRHADVRNSRHAGRPDGRDLDRRIFGKIGGSAPRPGGMDG